MIKRCIVAVMILVATFVETATGSERMTPPEHCRGEDQTYLTFPEWFLVHSPAEYAAFLKHADPHDFPLLAHVGQLWSSYFDVIRATRGYPFNGEYHVMINVIAISTTVEYGLKAFYENTVGRLTAALRGHERTTEDEFAAATAQRYVDFIRDRPWYEFPFFEELVTLWRLENRQGSALRRWERRFALSSELIVKAIYGRLIEFGTRSSFDKPISVTMVVIDGTSADALQGLLPQPPILLPEGRALIPLPRYEQFAKQARRLSQGGARFVEIACNRNVVLVSLLTNQPGSPPWARKTIIRQPYLTSPGWRREAVEVPIRRLHEALLNDDKQIIIEHVYDF